jgi:hypothetical protein
MKSMLFAAAMVLSLVVSSATASPAGAPGQPIVSDPLNDNCQCAVYWMGRWWCVPCG